MEGPNRTANRKSASHVTTAPLGWKPSVLGDGRAGSSNQDAEGRADREQVEDNRLQRHDDRAEGARREAQHEHERPRPRLLPVALDAPKQRRRATSAGRTAWSPAHGATTARASSVQNRRTAYGPDPRSWRSRRVGEKLAETPLVPV